jgi:hypothetical protein|tara:strand:- start:1130 stop:1390 length:261 start_codon:yes stop_codon:yes gene_type:complete
MSKEEGKDRDIVNNFFAFQTQRKITNLYKQFFFILEDLQASGVKIPEEQHQRIRKRILDLGNDTIRELEEYFEKFIEYNNNNNKQK